MEIYAFIMKVFHFNFEMLGQWLKNEKGSDDPSDPDRFLVKSLTMSTDFLKAGK